MEAFLVGIYGHLSKGLATLWALDFVGGVGSGAPLVIAQGDGGIGGQRLDGWMLSVHVCGMGLADLRLVISCGLEKAPGAML